MTGWRVTFDRATAFVAGPKAEARRRIEACGDGGAMWVARRNAWATSPSVASGVLDQLAARRVPVIVEHADQVELDLTATEKNISIGIERQEALW